MTNAEFITFLTSVKNKLIASGVDSGPIRGQAWIQDWIDAVTAADPTPYTEVRVRNRDWTRPYWYGVYTLEHNLYHS